MIAPDTAAGVLLGALLSGIVNVGPFLFLVAASPRTARLMRGTRA